MTYTKLSKEAKEYLEFIRHGISKEDRTKAFISLSFGARLEVQRFESSKYYIDSNKTEF